MLLIFSFAAALDSSTSFAASVVAGFEGELDSEGAGVGEVLGSSTGAAEGTAFMTLADSSTSVEVFGIITTLVQVGHCPFFPAC